MRDSRRSFMRFLLSVVVGIVAGLLAVVIADVALIGAGVLKVWYAMHSDSGAGIGAFSVGMPGSGIVAAPIGFALGFWWRWRHHRGALGR